MVTGKDLVTGQRLHRGIEAGSVILGLVGLKILTKGDEAAALSGEVVQAVNKNINLNSRTAVIGHFPGYIDKAVRRKASHFDIGDLWNGLDNSQRWAANKLFLDTIGKRGDDVLLSLPIMDVRPQSILADEIKLLREAHGYKCVNQWALNKPKN